MSEMMKQVEAQLANLPKEQREAMMKSMPGLASMQERETAAAFDFEWTGDKREVAGYPCRVARVTKGGNDDGEACIAKPDDIGMSKADFESLASMFDTMQEFAAMSGESGMPDMREIGGFPIATSSKKDRSKSTLTSASDDKLDGAAFEVPAGYKQRTMPKF